MKNIKWENIVVVLLVALFSYQMLSHYQLNGLYIEMIIEIIIDIMFLFTERYIVKDIRKNPENWK